MRLIRDILTVTISLMVLASCLNADDFSNELIYTLQGLPKKKVEWGSIAENIPNNIGNTFTGDPKTTRTITWQSTIDTGEVIIGNNHYPSIAVKQGTFYFHRVDITGLEPGKTYRFVAGSLNSYSPIYSFRTESLNFPNGFSIIHITDPQIGTDKDATDAEVWKQVIEAALKKCPDAAFVVNTGDIVNNIKIARIPYYFDYAQETLAKYAFMYAFGNNDSLDWFDNYFYITENRYQDASGVIYSFDYGNAHFVSINNNFTSDDDNEDDSSVELSYGQMTWLEDDLKNSSKKWKVVMLHKPDFGRKSASNANTDLTKLFDKYNVNLVMAGHYHFYGRTNPINSKGESKINGTVWSIPNTAGTKFNEESTRSYLAVNEQPELPMFCELRFTTSDIYITAYTVDSTGKITPYPAYHFH